MGLTCAPWLTLHAVIRVLSPGSRVLVVVLGGRGTHCDLFVSFPSLQDHREEGGEDHVSDLADGGEVPPPLLSVPFLTSSISWV